MVNLKIYLEKLILKSKNSVAVSSDIPFAFGIILNLIGKNCELKNVFSFRF